MICRLSISSVGNALKGILSVFSMWHNKLSQPFSSLFSVPLKQFSSSVPVLTAAFLYLPYIELQAICVFHIQLFAVTLFSDAKTKSKAAVLRMLMLLFLMIRRFNWFSTVEHFVTEPCERCRSFKRFWKSFVTEKCVLYIQPTLLNVFCLNLIIQNDLFFNNSPKIKWNRHEKDGFFVSFFDPLRADLPLGTTHCDIAGSQSFCLAHYW